LLAAKKTWVWVICSLVILITQSVLMLDLQGERRVRKKNLGDVVEF